MSHKFTGPTDPQPVKRIKIEGENEINFDANSNDDNLSSLDVNRYLEISSLNGESANEKRKSLKRKHPDDNLEQYPNIKVEQGSNPEAVISSVDVFVKEEPLEFEDYQLHDHQHNHNDAKYVCLTQEQFGQMYGAILEIKRNTEDLSRRVEMIQEVLIGTNSAEFKKIGSEEEFKEFLRQMDNPLEFSVFVKKLKMIGSNSRCHIQRHGKVASIINFMFETDLIQVLRWSNRSGTPVSNTICLSNPEYSKFFALIKCVLTEEKEDGTLSIPDDKSIQSSIKNYFKNHIKKPEVVD